MTIWPDKSVGFIRPAHVRETNDGVLFFAVALLVVVLTTWTYRPPGSHQSFASGASFSVLVAAEMMGVRSGLGGYLQWAQGWAAYTNMYAALIVMGCFFLR